MSTLRSQFRPEFLNRVDEIVMFTPLLVEQIKQVIDLLMQRLESRLAERKISVRLSDAAKDFIAREAYDPIYGARPLRRYLQTHIESPLAKKLIGGELMDGQKILVDEKNGQLAFVLEAAEAAV
jgi:ATP-dependent Clp protease ATP-binding subunit ClpB